MAKDDLDPKEDKIFGDLVPDPDTRDHLPGPAGSGDDEDVDSMDAGSQGDSQHAGSRDVTGVSGGTGTETGGTRNLRQGTGATGGDIGNRPEPYRPSKI